MGRGAFFPICPLTRIFASLEKASRMKCFKLNPKSALRLSDNLLLAKAPLIPHQYLFKAQGYDLALMQHRDDGSFLLICSAEEFWSSYQAYYEARFEMEAMPEDYEVPEAYEVVLGRVQFEDGSSIAPEATPSDGEEPAEEAAEGA
jgi:hypothetical protein